MYTVCGSVKLVLGIFSSFWAIGQQSKIYCVYDNRNRKRVGNAAVRSCVQFVYLFEYKTVKMSSGALFGGTSGRSQSKNLVEFRAGKMTMKGRTVYPDKRKGTVYVYQSDDSLMHFCWRERSKSTAEDVHSRLRLTYFVFETSTLLNVFNYLNLYYFADCDVGC